MEALLPYLPTDRRHALARGETLPDRAQGAALFVDISGFTPLAEALAEDLGPQRGAEELTLHLNRVYDALIAELDRYRGSVIGFSGDAVTCWFAGDRGAAAAASALMMQRAMEQLGAATLPGGRQFPLSIKAGVAAGLARRFLVGDPDRQLIDVLAGRLMDEMAEAEHLAGAGEVVLGPSALAGVEDQVETQRRIEHAGRHWAVVAGMVAGIHPDPWPPLAPDALPDAQVKPWLLAPVYERLRAGQGDFLAELRPAVALFLRFGGIDYDADDLAESKLDEFVRRVHRIVASYDGTLVDISIGDKGSYLYVAFGAPVAHEDDFERAAAAALDIRSDASHLPFIDSFQVGINRGRMRTGAYGGRTRRTYGVLGDATNLAARLMAAAGPGEILMSRSALAKLPQSFQWSSRPPLRVKGKAEPIEVVSLVGRGEAGLPEREDGKYPLPMVGRERELAIVHEKVGLASEGKGQVLAVTAEAGMGKSRLIAEALRAAARSGSTVVQGECKSYGMQSSYLVWSGIWRGLFRLDGSIPAEAQISALGAVLAELDQELVARLPLLAPLLNLPIPDNDLTRSFDAKLRKNSLEWMLVDLLRGLARKGNLVLVLEDTHWIDPLSLDLLDVLGAGVAELPVLMLLAYRPEADGAGRGSPRNRWPHFMELALDRLTPQQAGQWMALKLAQLYGPDLRPLEAFTNRLVARAEGNPFYIEELLNYLRDNEISPMDERALSGLDLPVSLHSLVLTRIDQLAERPRSTLRVASVFGRTFRGSDLLGAYPGLDGKQGIAGELDELDRKGFIELESGVEDSFAFKHSVIQEVAYGSLPFNLRRDLHESIGDFVERTYADALQQHTDELAYHYFKGEVWPKGLDYKLQAGRRAQSEYANQAAIEAARDALTAAGHLGPSPDTTPKCLAAYEILGQVLGWQAQYSDSIEAFSQMLRLGEELEDPEAQARAWHGMSQSRMHQGDIRGAIESAKQGEAVAAKSGLEAAKVRARWMQGWGAFRLGEIQTALELANTTAALSAGLADRGQHAENLNLLGVLHWASGNYDEAARSFNEALATFREIGDDRRAMPLLNNLGVIAESKGDFGSAMEGYAQALAIARRIGNRDMEMMYLGNLGGAKVLQGDYTEAEPLLRTILDPSNPAGMEVLADAHSYLAEACLGLGKTEKALELARRAQDIAVTTESQDDLGVAWRVLGMVAARLPGPLAVNHPPSGGSHAVTAEMCFAESDRTFREMAREDELARTLRAWARYELEFGDRDKAAARWKEARALFEKIGATHEVARMAELPGFAAGASWSNRSEQQGAPAGNPGHLG